MVQLICAELPVMEGGSFYSQAGDWFAGLCLAGLLLAGILKVLLVF